MTKEKHIFTFQISEPNTPWEDISRFYFELTQEESSTIAKALCLTHKKTIRKAVQPYDNGSYYHYEHLVTDFAKTVVKLVDKLKSET